MLSYPKRPSKSDATWTVRIRVASDGTSTSSSSTLRTLIAKETTMWRILSQQSTSMRPQRIRCRQTHLQPTIEEEPPIWTRTSRRHFWNCTRISSWTTTSKMSAYAVAMEMRRRRSSLKTSQFSHLTWVWGKVEVQTTKSTPSMSMMKIHRIFIWSPILTVKTD